MSESKVIPRRVCAILGLKHGISVTVLWLSFGH